MLQPALIPLHHKQENTISMDQDSKAPQRYGLHFSESSESLSDQIRKIYYFPTFLESKSDFLICRHLYPSIDK